MFMYLPMVWKALLEVGEISGCGGDIGKPKGDGGKGTGLKMSRSFSTRHDNFRQLDD